MVLDVEIHRARRGRLMEQFPDEPILVRGDGAEGASASFVYLTGLAEPRGVLLLAARGARIGTGRAHPGPDYVRGRMAREVLFLPPHDPLAARWGEGSAYTPRSVSAEQAGVDAVLGLDELHAVLDGALRVTPALAYVRGRPASLSGGDDPDSEFTERVRRRFFHLRLDDATPAVHAVRCAKDASEIRAIERAVAVVAEALHRVLALVRPGMHEYEVEAEIDRVYRGHGGRHAFEPIVACGANALALHYTDNAGPLEAGRLLLIDTGVSIEHYKADVSRTIPVGGRFSDRQREVYAAVLRAQQETIDACRPGARIGDLHAGAHAAIASAGLGEHFVHGIGHHLGLETHDAGNVHDPLPVGAVITVEPGVYLPGEALGVRIEDDVLVTPEGRRLLSQAIPRSIEEIEQRMAAR
jgi:Xaa-Pro aminopeptidase